MREYGGIAWSDRDADLSARLDMDGNVPLRAVSEGLSSLQLRADVLMSFIMPLNGASKFLPRLGARNVLHSLLLYT